MEELTANQFERSTASEEAPKGWVIDGGDWRERKHVDEGKFDPIVTKTKKLRYLRAWGTTTDLRVASASLNRHQSSRATAAVVSERRSEKREKKGGQAWVL